MEKTALVVRLANCPDGRVFVSSQGDGSRNLIHHLLNNDIPGTDCSEGIMVEGQIPEEILFCETDDQAKVRSKIEAWEKENEAEITWGQSNQEMINLIHTLFEALMKRGKIKAI